MPSEVEACEITGKDTAEEALEVLLGGGKDGGVGLVVIKRGAMVGLSLSLPGGVRLVTWTIRYWLSSTGDLTVN